MIFWHDISPVISAFFNSEASKIKFVENYFSLETTLLQREPFLTTFYTINSSP